MTTTASRGQCIALCLAALAASPACTETPQTADQLEANKQLLLDFFASPLPREERAERFMAEDYI
jgi:predicted SnoaL-like aldol condensation-catalyzing enzyme